MIAPDLTNPAEERSKKGINLNTALEVSRSPCLVVLISRGQGVMRNENLSRIYWSLSV